MNQNKEKSVKEIVNLRFQNPKFLFDGKRVQPVYERKCYDSVSGIVCRTQMQRPRIFLDPRYDRSSQALAVPTPELASPHDVVYRKFLHMSINKIRSPINAIAWNLDGGRLLSGSTNGEVTMWNGLSFNFDTILQAHEAPIRAMAWAPSASFLLTSDSTGTVKYWNTSMNNINQIVGGGEAVKDLSFGHSDTKFCSGSDDGAVRVWDSVKAVCERVFLGHNWDVRKAQWHKQFSLIASGGRDNVTKFWDPRAQECIGEIHAHKNTILSMCYTGSGNHLLTGGRDQSVKMTDLRKMEEAFTYKSRDLEVTALTAHPFTPAFVSGYNDGTIMHWEEMYGKPMASSNESHDNAVWCLEYNPSGNILASGGADFMVKFWGRDRPYDIKAEE